MQLSRLHARTYSKVFVLDGSSHPVKGVLLGTLHAYTNAQAPTCVINEVEKARAEPAFLAACYPIVTDEHICNVADGFSAEPAYYKAGL